MSKKALFITLGAVAVAAAALVPYKVKTEKDEETQKTTGLKLRALTYTLNVTADSERTGVDIEFKVPNVKNVNIVSISKHLDLTKKADEGECCCAATEEPECCCASEESECCCEAAAEEELAAEEEAQNEAVECL